MARPESTAMGGYYPFPAHLHAALASLVRAPAGSAARHAGLAALDPCAGEGAALAALGDALAAGGCHPALTGCELEPGRAASLRAALGRRSWSTSLQGDAFALSWTGHADLLLLNPPYDTDREAGRLEARWLARFLPAMRPGTGALLLVVPAHALPAMAALLAAECGDLACWRFPDPDYAAYKQVVVRARLLASGARATRALAGDMAHREAILGWAGAPLSLPVLGAGEGEGQGGEGPPVLVAGGGLAARVAGMDLAAVAAAWGPWRAGDGCLPAPRSGTDRTMAELAGRPFPVALPPKAAHVALAVAAGAFNGAELSPEEGTDLPRILVKATFARTYVDVDRRESADGRTERVTQVQRPRLALRALDLERGTTHTLASGTGETGGSSLDGMAMADLLRGYRGALSSLLAGRFPALHDPARDGTTPALPPLGRPLFAAQATAGRAVLGLLWRGENPLLLGEVGSGKSAIALAVLAALGPRHLGATRAALRDVAGAGRLGGARRALALLPPHLLASWAEEAAAVLPGLRVVPLHDLGALRRAAAAPPPAPPAPGDPPGAGQELWLLSRETAKLGPATAGIAGGRCPRCGREAEGSPEALARGRLRCPGGAGRPAPGEAGDLALRLACLLARHQPGSEAVRALVPAGLARRAARARGPAPRWRGGPDAPGLAAALARACRAASAGSDYEAAAGSRAAMSGLLASLPGDLRPAALAAAQAATRGEGPAGEGHWAREGLAGMREGWARAAGMEDTPAGRAVWARGDPGRAAEGLAALLAGAPALAGGPCGEPLWAYTAKPRRWPLARAVAALPRGTLGLVILDEAQEYAGAGSAQEKAAHRLSALQGVPTLALSGSVANGYASNLFPTLWALSRDFRAAYGRDDESLWTSREGYRKRQVTEAARGGAGAGAGAGAGIRGYGSASDREDRVDPEAKALGEAPGISPRAILRHVLPTAVVLHKDDLAQDLPPCRELPVDIAAGPGDKARLAAYARLREDLLARVRQDRGTERAGALWGAMAELPSYLDLAARGVGNVDGDGPGGRAYAARYPDGEDAATAPLFPEGELSGKERWLLDTLEAELAEGRDCLVFVRHTGGGRLPRRLLELIGARLGPVAAWLDAGKVQASARQAWIRAEATGKGRRVLLVNPNAVRTGLNVLVAYSTAIWHELDHSAVCYRQANGRLHRVGQTREVRIYYPAHAGTAQAVARELLAAKVRASLQIDGLDLESALAAAGTGDPDLAGALSLGQEIHRRLVATPERDFRDLPAPVPVPAIAPAPAPMPMPMPMPMPAPLRGPATAPMPMPMPGGAWERSAAVAAASRGFAELAALRELAHGGRVRRPAGQGSLFDDQ